MVSPLTPGAIGELYWQVAEAVVLVHDDRVLAWNPAAEKMFGVAPPVNTPVEDVLAPALGAAYDEVRALLRSPGSGTVGPAPTSGLVLDVTTWRLSDGDVVVLLLRDITADRRFTSGLARLTALGRELFTGDPTLPDL